MRLRLNPTKTELIWFHRNKHPAHPLNNQSLQLDPNCTITSVNTVRNLGVLLDSSLNLKAHITSVTRSWFFHLRRIRQVKKCLNERCLRFLVQALVISRIDYCNSILAGLPAVTIHPLTTVLHAAARIIKDIPHWDHITPAMRNLHWLPIPARVTFKLCSPTISFHIALPLICPQWSTRARIKQKVVDFDQHPVAMRWFLKRTGTTESVLSQSLDQLPGTVGLFKFEERTL